MGYGTAGCMVMLTLSLLAMPFATCAQPAGKLPRVGVLEPGIPPGEPCCGGQRFR
jgi:hypothetical protein